MNYKAAKKQKRWVWNEAGFGIAEGMISAGVVAVVVLGMSSFMNMQTNTARRMNVKYEALAYQSVVSRAFSEPFSCDCIISGLGLGGIAPGAATNLGGLTSCSGENILTVGDPLPSLPTSAGGAGAPLPLIVSSIRLHNQGVIRSIKTPPAPGTSTELESFHGTIIAELDVDPAKTGIEAVGGVFQPIEVSAVMVYNTATNTIEGCLGGNYEDYYIEETTQAGLAYQNAIQASINAANAAKQTIVNQAAVYDTAMVNHRNIENAAIVQRENDASTAMVNRRTEVETDMTSEANRAVNSMTTHEATVVAAINGARTAAESDLQNHLNSVRSQMDAAADAHIASTRSRLDTLSPSGPPVIVPNPGGGGGTCNATSGTMTIIQPPTNEFSTYPWRVTTRVQGDSGDPGDPFFNYEVTVTGSAHADNGTAGNGVTATVNLASNPGTNWVYHITGYTAAGCRLTTTLSGSVNGSP